MRLRVRGWARDANGESLGVGYAKILGEMEATPTAPGDFLFVDVEPAAGEVVHVEFPVPIGKPPIGPSQYQFARVIIYGRDPEHRENPVVLVRLYATEEDCRQHAAAKQFEIQLWDGQIAPEPKPPPSTSAGWPPPG